ncbi:MAG: hypothetical protein QMB63_03520, partial [Clostridiaceae bacterium]
ALMVIVTGVLVLIPDLFKKDKAEEPPVISNTTKPLVKTEKPFIYLYPTKNTAIDIKLELKGEMTNSYPKYKDGWRVTANSEGIIWDEDHNVYTGLYWEANLGNYEIKKGFTVKRDDMELFLFEKLGVLGLNQFEIKDFMEYWGDRLKKYEYSDITFLDNEYTDRAKIISDPVPDTTIRVFMVFQEGSKDSKLEPQTLEPKVRQGFTLVEWGGAELKGKKY